MKDVEDQQALLTTCHNKIPPKIEGICWTRMSIARKRLRLVFYEKCETLSPSQVSLNCMAGNCCAVRLDRHLFGPCGWTSLSFVICVVPCCLSFLLLSSFFHAYCNAVEVLVTPACQAPASMRLKLSDGLRSKTSVRSVYLQRGLSTIDNPMMLHV